MILLATLFFAQFGSVFALVLNSKLLRDDRWVLATINSWFISATQYVFVYVVAQATAEDAVLQFLFMAAGGSTGLAVSHHFYHRVVEKKNVLTCNSNPV